VTIAGLAGLIALAAIAAYVQTLTGFAMGLILVGGVGLSGVMSLPDAAVLISVLTVVNGVVVFARNWHGVAWRELGLSFAGSLLALFAGYALLQVLAEASLDWLRLVLGLVIVVSSLQLLWRPQPLPQRSPAASFAGFGVIAGLMGGMFSTSGPPLVYHFYRQPMPHDTVRKTLLLYFGISGIIRLGMVAASGHVPPLSLWWSLLAIPVVMGVTVLARRWPPPLGQAAMRRIVFVLLMLSGLSLLVPAALRLGGLA
jgi:uncharacterized membrane protein YfcA